MSAKTEYALIGVFAVACLLLAPRAWERWKPVEVLSDDLSLVGLDVSELETVDAEGELHSLATGEELLLMVFHSECGWCRQVAPTWKRWLEENPDRPTLAVSGESLDVARAYADEHGWSVEVHRLPEGGLGSWSQALLSRTPWLFVISGEGIIEREAHGNTIDSLVVPDSSREVVQ